jgi:hypothetical protein
MRDLGALQLHYGAPATDQLNQQDDQCDDQQNVDVCADRVKTHQANQPQHKQNNKDCPEHLSSPLSHAFVATLVLSC